MDETLICFHIVGLAILSVTPSIHALSSRYLHCELSLEMRGLTQTLSLASHVVSIPHTRSLGRKQDGELLELPQRGMDTLNMLNPSLIACLQP